MTKFRHRLGSGIPTKDGDDHDLMDLADADQVKQPLDTDVTLAANSDARIPSQKAVKAYVLAHAGGGGAVSSVDTRIGDVVLTSADVGLGNVTNDVQLKASALDTDATLAANSDTKVASQKAVKAYVDANAGAAADPTVLIEADAFIDYVVSGLALPATSADLTGSLSAGAAYVIGTRVSVSATAHSYTASKDTYVDLSNAGVLTYSAVANAAGAPAVAANSIRLGFVTTDGSVITGATTTGKDSLGNWMRNTLRVPVCKLFVVAAVAVTAATPTPLPFGAGSTLYDNDGMHSETVANTRITFLRPGLYHVGGSCQFTGTVDPQVSYISGFINGAEVRHLETYQDWEAGTVSYPMASFAGTVIVEANDYVELNLNLGATSTTYAYGLWAAKMA